MKLGLGLGLSAQTHAAQITVINDAIVLATGQSLQDQLFTAYSGAGDTAFQAEAALYFPGTITHTDAAATNQYLTKSSYDASGDTGARYYWDDTTSSKGARYTAEIDPVSDKDTYTAVKVDLGQSDGINTSFPHTKAQYKTFYKEFLAQIKSDFPNATIFMNILNRTRQSGDFDAGYNLVRQAQLEIIDEVSYVVRGIDVYDLEMTDNFHLTQAGAEEYAEREARKIAKHFGKPVTGALGPYITNLVSRTDRVEFDVVHDGGTDWTAPSGTGAIAVEDDGTATGDVSVTRTDATSGVIILPEGEAPLHGSTLEGFVNYGDGGALGATPSVAIDNATNPLPFRSAANITVQNGDPLQSLDNVISRIHARGSAKTYSSSNIVDTITALQGTDFSVPGAATGPEFTTNYIRFTDTTDRLLLDSDFSNSTTFTIGLCGKFSGAIASFSILGNFTNTAGTTTNFSRIITQSGGTIAFQANSANAVQAIGTGLGSGDDFIIFLRFNSTSSADGYVNTTTATNFDPRDDYSVANRFSLGDSTNQTPFAADIQLYDFFLTSDAITDQELQNIYDFWDLEFDLEL